ncbi:hypothetical protein RCC30_14430 [Pseudomonas fluorescens]|nr:hypothetical protein RCC30_14430 [Pseudomonas fluorescens]
MKQGLDDRLDDACPKAGIQSIANQLKLDLVNSQAQVVDLSMELASASQLDGEV